MDLNLPNHVSNYAPHFSSFRANGRLGWKDLLKTNTLVFFALTSSINISFSVLNQWWGRQWQFRPLHSVMGKGYSRPFTASSSMNFSHYLIWVNPNSIYKVTTWPPYGAWFRVCIHKMFDSYVFLIFVTYTQNII